MTQDGMKTYTAELTNARANAGAIVLYQHEEASLLKALSGLTALRSARKAFLMVNPSNERYFKAGGGGVYDEHQIDAMIDLIENQLILCQSRITNMKETFAQFTGMSWAEKVENGIVGEWTREEDVANGTVLLTKEV